MKGSAKNNIMKLVKAGKEEEFEALLHLLTQPISKIAMRDPPAVARLTKANLNICINRMDKLAFYINLITERVTRIYYS